MAVSTLQAAPRPRAYVAVTGPEAGAYLERMLTNEVETLLAGESREALLLTAKGRIVAPVVAWRRGPDDFLLLTEPEAGARLHHELRRHRFAAKCEIAEEEHRSLLVLHADETALPGGLPTRDYGVPAVELLDRDPPDGAAPVTGSELERLRILARTPRLGRELDERVLPAEAGLDERAISFTKGCYPGQEPVARLHHRGHPNRGLRVLALGEGGLPPYDAELELGGKVVGRLTSAAPDPDHGVVALAYVRREVPPDAVLELGERSATQLAG